MGENKEDGNRSYSQLNDNRITFLSLFSFKHRSIKLSGSKSTKSFAASATTATLQTRLTLLFQVNLIGDLFNPYISKNSTSTVQL